MAFLVLVVSLRLPLLRGIVGESQPLSQLNVYIAFMTSATGD